MIDISSFQASVWAHKAPPGRRHGKRQARQVSSLWPPWKRCVLSRGTPSRNSHFTDAQTDKQETKKLTWSLPVCYFSVSGQKSPDFKNHSLSWVNHLKIPTFNRPKVKSITAGSSPQYLGTYGHWIGAQEIQVSVLALPWASPWPQSTTSRVVFPHLWTEWAESEDYDFQLEKNRILLSAKHAFRHTCC